MEQVVIDAEGFFGLAGLLVELAQLRRECEVAGISFFAVLEKGYGLVRLSDDSEGRRVADAGELGWLQFPGLAVVGGCQFGTEGRLFCSAVLRPLRLWLP
jgi:hypothetical protein